MESIILIIIFLICIFKSNIKGFVGERVVSGVLKQLPEDKYSVLNDILLKTEYGTTQIDHVVISIYGIFVIETKNYKGWITGSEYADNWTKNMYGRKYSFRNPIKQNFAHIKALQDITKFSHDKFFSIIAFSGNASIKVKTNTPVVYIRELKETIEKFQERKLGDAEVKYWTRVIQGQSITDRKAKIKHVSEIQGKVSENNRKIASGICPRCGGNLVERNGKFGVFVGCNNYPRCRYTLKE